VLVVPFVVSTLSTQSVSQHHNDVAHHTSLRSRRTMMTSANSLHQSLGGHANPAINRHLKTGN
jgi:hypothetical protein